MAKELPVGIYLPLLNKLYHPLWIYTIQKNDAEHELNEIIPYDAELEFPPQGPEFTANINKKAQASRLITFTITEDILTTRRVHTTANPPPDADFHCHTL